MIVENKTFLYGSMCVWHQIEASNP